MEKMDCLTPLHHNFHYNQSSNEVDHRFIIFVIVFLRAPVYYQYMMYSGSHSAMCRLVIGILFLASLALQVKVVYACQLMEGIPLESCCCEEMAVNDCLGEDDGSNEKITSEPCCNIIVTPNEDASLSKSNAAIPPDKGYLKTPYSFSFIPVANNLVPASVSDRHLVRRTDITGHNGTEIYLLTQRFRE